MRGRRVRSASGQVPTYGAILRGGVAFLASFFAALLTPVLLGLARALLSGALVICSGAAVESAIFCDVGTI